MIIVSGLATSDCGDSFNAGDSFGHLELLRGGCWTQTVVATEEVN